MGLKTLKDLLERAQQLADENDQIPEDQKELISTYTFKALAGRRVAIDGNLAAHAEMSTATKKIVSKTQLLSEDPDRGLIRKEWLEAMIKFLEDSFLKHGILPIFVLDGVPHPLKLDTIRERAKIKAERIERIEEFRTQIQEARDLPYVNPKDMNEYKKLLCQHLIFGETEWNSLQTVLEHLGIPVLKAKHDAEATCCVLAKAGLVDAVYSRDGDCVVHECPFWLKEKTRQGFIGIETPRIREFLGYDRETYLVMFIIVGTDFDPGIKGVAFKTAMKLIEAYGNVENFPEKYKWEHIDFEAIAEIFEGEDPDQTLAEPLTEESFEARVHPEAHEILALYGLNAHFATRFHGYFRNHLAHASALED